MWKFPVGWCGRADVCALLIAACTLCRCRPPPTPRQPALAASAGLGSADSGEQAAGKT